MKRIIAIRPELALQETLELARELDLPMEGMALSRALPVDWLAPEAKAFDAILAGSANVFRHGGAQLNNLQSLPVWAVGETTAAAASRAGFSVAYLGTGGLQGLLDGLTSQPMHVLRLTTRDHVQLEWPESLTVETEIVYEMERLALSHVDAKRISENAIVLLFSASSARHFHEECVRLGVDVSQVTIVALGPRIAEEAGAGWRSVHAADKPNLAELLALAKTLWQM